MKPKTAQLIAMLERKEREAMAGQTHVYHFADAAIDRVVTEKLMGSGVIMTLTLLGGKEVFSPVMFRDGLSPDTIAAIKRDLVRSYKLSTMYKPRGVSDEDQDR